MRQSPMRRVVEPQALVMTAGLLLSTGCSAQLRDDQWSLLWLLAPLGGYALAGLLWASRYRRRQLRQWDLRVQPSSPAYLGASIPLVSVAAAVLVAFSIFNFTLADMDPRQRLINVGLWLVGTVFGGLSGFLAGIRWAEKRAAGGEKHG